jgi:hypothetical protein
VLDAMSAFEKASGGTIQVTLDDVVVGDRYAVAFLIATAECAGRHYAAREFDVFQLDGGTVTTFWSLSENPQATDEFWTWAARQHKE